MYLDCTYLCDLDYLRTSIAYVDWVRDRADADVDVLVSPETTGSGGTRFTLTFLGGARFAQLVDTLAFSTRPDATSDDLRRDLGHTLSLGLVRYLAHTGLAARVQVSVPATAGAPAQTTPTSDPWHAWVFTTSLNGNLQAEERTRFSSLYGQLSASRTTNAWKANLALSESYSQSRFVIDDSGTTIENISRSFGASGLVVRAISDHWSAGLRGSLTSSTYLNEKRYLRVTPAVEYDLFPYAESTRRQLRVLYGLGFDAFAYNDTTIFLKTSETLPVQTLSVAYARQEAWGTINVGADGSSYINDGAKHSAAVSGGVSLRVLRGLNLNLSGNYSIVHDQVYLAKGAASESDVLLQQRQLLTGYRWYAFFGLSYTFGSVFNNVVNPRFGSSGSGGVIFF
ncbi:MAG TPA: hypothetical protein VG818_03520 [Gemmatimonadaceae bacterium]|nr:hypothetical protein [Gemmatimonadaceae bacterium]